MTRTKIMNPKQKYDTKQLQHKCIAKECIHRTDKEKTHLKFTHEIENSTLITMNLLTRVS